MAVRDLENGQDAVQSIKDEVPQAKIETMEVDLKNFRSIKKFVNEFSLKNIPLNLLINNAGIFHPGPLEITEEGFEQTILTDYHGQVYLTMLLVKKLEEGRPSRVIFVSSPAEMFGRLDWSNLKGNKYKDSGMTPYAASKLYEIMFARALQQKLKGTQVDVFATHPGLVATPLMRKLSFRYLTAIIIWLQALVFGQRPSKGAFSTLYAATAPRLKGRGFQYIGPNYLFNLFHTTSRRPVNSAARRLKNCQRLYDETLKIIEEVTGDQLAAP